MSPERTGRTKTVSSMLSVVIVALIVLFSYVGSAEAETAIFGVDPVADYAGTKVFRAPGTCANPGAYALVATFPKPAASGLLPDPAADGPYCHRALAYDTANNESVFSNTAEFTYNVVPPKAPQPFNVVP